ncbi:MAG: putative glycoside hydrolase [bacterium]|nr:putative glycoside hydrolase [bacterium]
MREGKSRAIASGAAVLLAVVAVLSLPISAQRKPFQSPRLANIFLKWHLNEEEARDLARWDVIVLDMEVPQNTPDAFALLRSLNPDAKLLAYVTSQEIRRDAAAHPQTPMRRQLASRIPDHWYLKSAAGERVSWWPQTWLLDVTNRDWTDALASFVAEHIAADPRWDGVFLDNLWGGVSWVPRAAIDLDGDGRAEDAAMLDQRWQDGVRALLTATRARSRVGFLVTGNGDATYADLVNGILLEHFPGTTGGDWSASMRAYVRVLERAVDPVIAIINVNTKNTGVQDPQLIRFGLTSTLLGGGFYSFDFGDLEHAQRWWYEAYEVALGDPQGAPVRIMDVRTASLTARPISAAGTSGTESFALGVYRRDYAHGLVLVNSTDVEQRVQFDEEFELAVGADIAGGDRRIVSEVVLPAKDGAILLRTIERIQGAPFTNGSFARVFRADGRTARNGFFAFDQRVRGRNTVEYRDLDGDGVVEEVSADGGTIRVQRGDQIIREFKPFGDRYRGAVNFAIGDLDRNGTWEIVVTERDRGARLGVFNLMEGRLLMPYRTPFGRQWTHGMTVAMMRRAPTAPPGIVVAAGPGASPEVRVLDARGIAITNRFLAYGAKFRGGVRIAAGDVDGDGRDEVVTGPGPGGGPHVRVFGVDGKLRTQFFAYAPERRSGVEVAVVDLDGNGIGEILGMSSNVFTVASDE